MQSSQIGRSNSRAALRSQQSLKKAMEEARRLSTISPLPPTKPIQLPPVVTADNILHILKGIDERDDSARSATPPRDFSPEPVENVIRQKPATAVDYENERNQNYPEPLISIKTSPPRVIKRKAPNALTPGHRTSGPPSNNSTLSVGDSKNNRHMACEATMNNKNNKGSNTSGGPSSKSTVQASDQTNSASEEADKNRSRETSADNSNPMSTNLFGPSGESQSIVRPRPRVSESPCIGNNIPDVAVIPGTPGPRTNRPEDRQKLVNVQPKSPRVNTGRSPRRMGGWL